MLRGRLELRRDFLGRLLSRRDWVYLLSLLVPFVVYDLALKTASIISQPGLAITLGLIQSDMFFDLGYVLLWVGLFAAARRGLTRRVVVVLFHVVTMLVVLVNTCAYQYLRQTGTALDYSTIALWLPEFKEVVPVLTGSVPLSAWTLLFATLLYVALGPWLVARTVERWQGWRGRSLAGTAESPFLGSVGLFLLALAFGSLSMTIGASPAGASKSFAMDPFVNVVLTGFEEASTDQEDVLDADSTAPAVETPDADASLAQTPETEKRNVVLIHLESTRAGATTPYNGNLETTPFLDELAKNSLLAERDYTIVPHTSKASVSVNCGIEPHLVQPTTEADSGGIPTPCLATLLKDQGYKSVFFQSSTQDFENFGGLVRNFGYEEYYPLESMDKEGFERTNYFGVEDDIMLKPSENWLKGHKGEPFLAEYLLGTGHHDYRCLDTHYGHEDFSEDALVNSYLNCMRLQDIFLKNLIDQYKKLGLYDNTIFVIYGDHGEGFGEHGRYQHDDTIYQEGLKVPLIIHAPGLLEGGERVKGLSNHTDILPTVLEMLGYEVKGGEYPGYSLLHELPEDRALNFSCFHEDACLARIEGNEKYIYHYGNQPDELFDLSEDPLERRNLADERAKEEMDKRREDLLIWRSSVNASYRPF
jgi:lipoteichoic acid synthase